MYRPWGWLGGGIRGVCGNRQRLTASKERMAARRSIAAAMVVFAGGLYAGVATWWSIDRLEKAPVLAVCVVEDVVKLGPVAAGTVRWPGTHQWHEATLRVERVHSKLARAPGAGERIVVRYVGFGDPVDGTSVGPVWPILEKGQRALFTLTPFGGRVDRWALFAAEGSHSLVPAIAREWRRAGATDTPREFLLTELINALANGSPSERYWAGSFLHTSLFGFPRETQALLDVAIGEDEERWLGVAAAMACSRIVWRPSLTELRAEPAGDVAGRGPVLGILGHALHKGVARGFPDRLIVKLVEDGAVDPGGTGSALVEFKDSAVLVERLRAALSRNQPGATIIAWELVRSGQRAVLPEALPAALHVVENPGAVYLSELRAASGLILDYGDDAQFGALVGTLRRLKLSDAEPYWQLFVATEHSGNQREIALAAVLIDDTRMARASMRYCDVAAGLLQRLSGKDFGVGEKMTRADWDRAVGRARAWLATL